MKIQNVPSEVTPNMELTLLDGRYKLNANRAIYSYEDKYKSFVQAFKNIQVPLSNQHSILVLGYGLGSISRLLIQNYKSQAQIKGVEIDPAVIELNSIYGFQSEQIQVLQKDALQFLQLNTNRYDLICHDVFIDYTIPNFCFGYDYLKNLKSSLASDGILLFSLMNFNKTQKEQNNLYFQKQFLPIFSNAEFWDLNGNAMIFFKNNTQLSN